MMKIMKDNGLSDEATAKGNRNYDSMNKLMGNISDAEYNEKIMF